MSKPTIPLPPCRVTIALLAMGVFTAFCIVHTLLHFYVAILHWLYDLRYS